MACLDEIRLEFMAERERLARDLEHMKMRLDRLNRLDVNVCGRVMRNRIYAYRHRLAYMIDQMMPKAQRRAANILEGLES